MYIFPIESLMGKNEICGYKDNVLCIQQKKKKKWEDNVFSIPLTSKYFP